MRKLKRLLRQLKQLLSRMLPGNSVARDIAVAHSDFAEEGLHIQETGRPIVGFFGTEARQAEDGFEPVYQERVLHTPEDLAVGEVVEARDLVWTVVRKAEAEGCYQYVMRLAQAFSDCLQADDGRRILASDGRCIRVN